MVRNEPIISVYSQHHVHTLLNNQKNRKQQQQHIHHQHVSDLTSTSSSSSYAIRTTSNTISITSTNTSNSLDSINPILSLHQQHQHHQQQLLIHKPPIFLSANSHNLTYMTEFLEHSIAQINNRSIPCWGDSYGGTRDDFLNGQWKDIIGISIILCIYEYYVYMYLIYDIYYHTSVQTYKLCTYKCIY